MYASSVSDSIFRATKALFILMSLLILGACSWVDSTGIQSNESPDIQLDAANAAVEQRAVRWPFSSLDPDGNIQRVEVNLLAEGREITSCGAWFTPLESVDTLRDACQPSLTDSQCAVNIETASDAVVLNFPALRYPIGLRYELSVLDTGLASTTRAVDICVQTESAPPVGVADDYSVTYGSALTASAVDWGETCEVVSGTGVLANDTDDFDYRETTDSGAPCLVAELLTQPRFSARFSFEADGSFEYLGDGSVGPGGEDGFTYRVNDGVNLSDPVEVSLAIVGSNLPPVANSVSRTMDEDGVLTVPVAELGSDPEGQTLSLASVSRPGQGTAEIRDSSIVYRPPADFSGTTQLRFTVVDRGGASASETLNITVREVNDPPEFVSLPSRVPIQVTNPGVPADVTVAARVRDDESAASQLVISTSIDSSFALVEVSGTDSEGRAVITLSPLSNGAEDMQVTVRDTGVSGLAAESTTRTVRVEISGVNEPPVAETDSVSVIKGEAVNVPVLDNDSDPEDGKPELIAILSPPENGTATVLGDGASIRYTPDTGFFGNDTFTYTVRDSLGAEATGTVNVRVINQAPVAADDTFSVDGLTPTLLSPLSNDSDPDGDDVRIVSISNISPPAASISIAGDSVLFQSRDGLEGVVRFDYQIDDFNGLTSTATVTVNVAEEDRPDR